MRSRYMRFVAVVGVGWCCDALAHHSGAVFDLDTQIELRGVVVDFTLRSPHASFVLDARVFENGVPRDEPVARWEVEWESVPMLRTLGIDAETFAPGDDVTIFATPHRDRTFLFAHAFAVDDGFGTRYVMANSNRLFSPSLRAAAAAVGSDVVTEVPANTTVEADNARLAGRWQQPFLEFPPVGTPGLPLNDAGMTAWRNYALEQSPANACEPINVPDLLSAPFFLLDVRIDSQRVVLHHEAFDVVRTVPLVGEAAPADADGRFGVVRGRIEGDSLVVESRDFAPSAWGLGIEEQHGGGVIPSSRSKTLTERFSPTTDGGTLMYTYTLFDPAYMTAPHSGRVELTRVPDEMEQYPYECDLESAAMWSRVPTDSPLRVEPSRR